jgi:hypothetical protein
VSGSDIFQAICDTLKANVQQSTSWFPCAVTLGSGNYPAGMVVFSNDNNEYGETFDPTHTVFLDVELHVRGELVTANRIMTDYVWPGSGSCIYDALELDPTLDGLVMRVAATGFRLDPYDGPDEDYVGRVRLRVMT